jgi:hypothetical protein
MPAPSNIHSWMKQGNFLANSVTRFKADYRVLLGLGCAIKAMLEQSRLNQTIDKPIVAGFQTRHADSERDS